MQDLAYNAFGVTVQIREILQADQAPGSGTKVKEADGSSETNGSDAAGLGRSAIKDGLSNGSMSITSGEFNATAQQKSDDVTILGKSKACETPPLPTIMAAFCGLMFTQEPPP